MCFIPIAIQASALKVLNQNLEMPIMMEESKQTNYFIISNTTGDPVTISKVQTTCGCTFAKAQTNILAPHKTTQIIFAYKSFKLRGKTGNYSKSIILITPEEQYSLNFKGIYEAYFNIITRSTNLGKIFLNEEKEFTGKLRFEYHTNCGKPHVRNLIATHPEKVSVDYYIDEKNNEIVITYILKTSSFTDLSRVYC